MTEATILDQKSEQSVPNEAQEAAAELSRRLDNLPVSAGVDSKGNYVLTFTTTAAVVTELNRFYKVQVSPFTKGNRDDPASELCKGIMPFLKQHDPQQLGISTETHDAGGGKVEHSYIFAPDRLSHFRTWLSNHAGQLRLEICDKQSPATTHTAKLRGRQGMGTGDEHAGAFGFAGSSGVRAQR